MSMEDFAAQDVWQGSPLYEEMNNTMSRVPNSVLREYERGNNGATDCYKADEEKKNIVL